MQYFARRHVRPFTYRAIPIVTRFMGEERERLNFVFNHVMNNVIIPPWFCLKAEMIFNFTSLQNPKGKGSPWELERDC